MRSWLITFNVTLGIVHSNNRPTIEQKMAVFIGITVIAGLQAQYVFSHK